MKKLLFLLSFLVLFLAAAQETPLPDPEAYFSAVIVEDFESSLNWYTGVLGFKVINKQASEERGFKQANIKRGDILLELIELNSALSPKTALPGYTNKTRLTGFFKIGFLITDFDRWIKQLETLETSFYGNIVEDPVSKKRMVIITDPDGNRIQLFEK